MKSAFFGSDIHKLSAGFLAYGSRTFGCAFSCMAQWLAACLPVYSDRIAQDFHSVPFYPFGSFRTALKTQYSIINRRAETADAKNSLRTVLPTFVRRGDCGTTHRHYVREGQQKTEQIGIFVQSCPAQIPALYSSGTYHSLVRRIRYALSRQVF